jgi:hypothetical protein
MLPFDAEAASLATMPTHLLCAGLDGFQGGQRSSLAQLLCCSAAAAAHDLLHRDGRHTKASRARFGGRCTGVCLPGMTTAVPGGLEGSLCPAGTALGSWGMASGENMPAACICGMAS